MTSMKLLARAKATDFDKVACAGGDKKETCRMCVHALSNEICLLHVALEEVQIRYVIFFWSLGRPYGFTVRLAVLQFQIINKKQFAL